MMSTAPVRRRGPPKPNFWDPALTLTWAAAFYAIYLAGMWFFAVLPARGWRAGLARGAAFGLVAYATYDLTNQATFLYRETFQPLPNRLAARLCAEE